MKKSITRALTGFAAGVALNSILCITCSYVLRLGYYAPCFAGLTETCGGELNGALMQTCVFGLIGSAVGLTDCFWHQEKATKSQRPPALR